MEHGGVTRDTKDRYAVGALRNDARKKWVKRFSCQSARYDTGWDDEGTLPDAFNASASSFPRRRMCDRTATESALDYAFTFNHGEKGIQFFSNISKGNEFLTA